MTHGNIPNLVLKRMLRYFLKIPSLKKILQLRRQNFNKNARTFSENSTTHKNIKILRLKEDYKLIQKRKLQTRIKPITENLKVELCQLESKQAKSAKLRANIR